MQYLSNSRFFTILAVLLFGLVLFARVKENKALDTIEHPQVNMDTTIHIIYSK